MSEVVEEDMKKDLWDKFPKVNSYKYLGVNLNQNLSPKDHSEYLEKKLKRFKKMVLINRL